MNESQKAELKDNILRILADLRQDDYRDISRMSKELWRSFDACYVAVGELEHEGNEGYVEAKDHAIETFPKDKSVWITPEGRDFIDHDSYSSRLERESEQYAQATKPKPISTKEVIKIGSIIFFGLSTLILGWLKYSENKELEEVKFEINQIKHQNDSLFNVLNSKHVEIEDTAIKSQEMGSSNKGDRKKLP